MLNGPEDSDGKKLKRSKAKRSCANNENGFAEGLLACFERNDLSNDEYEDLVEQELIRLLQRDPKFLYSGHKRYIKN